jgi:DNA-binding transcriptional LysR family regulator
MHFSLKQIQVFVHVARYESISRAAESLAMSPSAVSGALCELERQFSIQLFDRIGKRLRLNALGHALQPQAEEWLDRAAALEALMKSQDACGPLAIGATLTLGNYLVTGLVAEYMQQHPASRVSLEVANTRHIVERMLCFALDVALIEGECHHPELITESWGGDSLEIFCAPDHPLAKQGQLSPRDFARETWIVRETGSGTREAFDRARAAHQLPIAIRLELEHTEGIKRAVESGLGLGCVSGLALREAFRRGSLVKLAAPWLDLRREFLLVYHRDKYLTPALQHFLRLCRESLAQGCLQRESRIP